MDREYFSESSPNKRNSTVLKTNSHKISDQCLKLVNQQFGNLVSKAAVPISKLISLRCKEKGNPQNRRVNTNRIDDKIRIN